MEVLGRGYSQVRQLRAIKLSRCTQGPDTDLYSRS